ncbi:M24 family metallopeptidase [Deinococcus roseus]|uniref:Aminopeptidase n=1 Tax=Deinococcus roseus TaxID=392414 RepID=A0ABQ2CXK4_9DEIO|nr:Xaa-Pro peptidase family protein [Deinococcus roseus]GGJ29464.1 aminopeptidase [Deinococcus roseus]
MQQPADLLTSHGLDALWVTKPENVRYLSGFSTPKDGLVLLHKEGALLYTDARYTEQAKEECFIPQHIARHSDVIQHARTLLEGKVVGYEADALLVNKLHQLAGLQAKKLVPTEGILEARRLIKTPEEIQLIRQAQQIADEALRQALPSLRAGVREVDLALQMEVYMRSHGAEDRAFDITVASGYRSAMPHGTASEKVIQEGELVTFDWGARYRGYYSDCTRAFPVGEISEELKNLYRHTQKALNLALEAIKPGVMTSDLDQVARGYLEEQGLAEHFVHSLGHGVGLAIHENPHLARFRPDLPQYNVPLQAGMVITIEPGLYVAGVGGVRLEELVLVTETGCEVLSHAPFAEV